MGWRIGAVVSVGWLLHRVSHLMMLPVGTVAIVVVSSIGMCSAIHLLKGAIAGVVKIRKFEFRLMYQGVIQGDVFQAVILSRGLELVLRVFERVIGNEMMLHVIHGHGHCFLEQTILFEFIRVDQRAD